MEIKNINRICIGGVLLVIVTGCATKPENIKPSYISPLVYQKYDCDQLSAEAKRISSRAADVTGVQKKKAKRDSVAMGVGTSSVLASSFLH